MKLPLQRWLAYVNPAAPADDRPAAPESPSFRRDFVLVIVFNSVIAALFAAILQRGFLYSFVYSQCIGLSIFLLTKLLMRRKAATKPTAAIMVVAVPAGGVLGTGLGFLLAPIVTGHPPAGAALLPGSLAGAVIFGVAISYYFYSRSTIAETTAAIREHEVQRLVVEKRASEAELRALQAQIEPHFLFNTLSNVASLIESDPAAAKRMLVTFTGYLRGNLERTRSPVTTLGQELDLVRRYLEIMAIRMGERLTWRIDADPALAEIALPPLIVQPFVENAIRHGLEPLPAGGEVAVVARRSGDVLEIDIRDTGAGWQAGDISGIGLANVKQRLAARFGDGAEVVVRPVEPHGVWIRVRVPLGRGSPQGGRA
ncbi:MAG: sensor histidine kinase [Burkholderiales bacterium]